MHIYSFSTNQRFVEEFIITDQFFINKLLTLKKNYFYLYTHILPVHIFFPGFGGEASLPPYRRRFLAAYIHNKCRRFVQIYFFRLYIYFSFTNRRFVDGCGEAKPPNLLTFKKSNFFWPALKNKFFSGYKSLICR